MTITYTKLPSTRAQKDSTQEKSSVIAKRQLGIQGGDTIYITKLRRSRDCIFPVSFIEKQFLNDKS